MGVWWVLVGVCAGVVGVVGSSRVSLENHGYRDILVGVSPDVPEADAPQLIDSIKELIQQTSADLYTATRNRVYMSEVSILVPYTWTNTPIDQPATWEKYQESDIRVDPQVDPHNGDRPHTRHYGTCGQPGDHIHLSLGYMLNHYYTAFFGTASRVLVKEWAKLRWGVFDEMGYMNDDKYPMFYKAPEDPLSLDVGFLSHEPTLCSDVVVEGVEGQYHDKNEPCVELTSEGVPAGSCSFFPDPDQTASSSLMSYEFIRNDSVVEFCDHDTHNRDAPTLHNHMCDGRSVWDVMNQHSDFNGNTGVAPAGAAPTIRVVRMVPPTFVLVLDYSGSMTTHERINKLQKTAQRYILHEVVEGSSVGIVRFDSKASVLADITTINSQTDREHLANKIHVNNDGGTSIGAGLVQAVSMLEGHHNKIIFLITDGEENEAPMIADVIDDVIASKACVVTVAYSNNADTKLDQLADRTGCLKFNVKDNDLTNAMGSAFESMTTYQPYVPALVQHKLYETQSLKMSSKEYEDVFIVDSGVGKNLIFKLWSDASGHVVRGPFLHAPDGSVLDTMEFDPISVTWSTTIPLAEAGTWKWRVELDGDMSTFIQASVSSQQRDASQPPIIVSTSTQVEEDNPYPKIKIIAQVMQGNNPVVGAKVKAFVTSPDESQAAVEYDLLDNGAFADVTKGDGVYSRYMSKFLGGTGRYNVKAVVTSTEDTMINTGQGGPAKTNRRRRSTAPKPPVVKPPCCGSVVPFDPATATRADNFTRISTGGSIMIDRAPDSSVDAVPPAAITDLRAVRVTENSTGPVLTLTWSAPGDDLDDGTVANYTFFLSDERDALKNQTAGSISPLEPTDGLQAALVPFGQLVEMNFTLPSYVDLSTPFYVGVVSSDEANNYSKMSNIEVFTVKKLLEMPDFVKELTKKLRESQRRWG